MLKNNHGTCDTRECCAKAAVECIQGEMGGGTYTYETLPAQVRAGAVSQSIIDETVRTMLRTKFALGLFESESKQKRIVERWTHKAITDPYPYEDWKDHIRTDASKKVLQQIDRETPVLLKNGGLLPLKKSGSIALLGPLANRDSFGYVKICFLCKSLPTYLLSDYIFESAHQYAINPKQGFETLLNGTGVTVNFAEGCKLWSNDQSGFPAAVEAAKKSDVAVVFVGTWSLDQVSLGRPDEVESAETDHDTSKAKPLELGEQRNNRRARRRERSRTRGCPTCSRPGYQGNRQADRRRAHLRQARC